LRFKLGNDEMLPKDKLSWEKHLTAFKTRLQDINMQIDKLNLTVPCLWQQLVHYNYQREIAKINKRFEEMRQNGETMEQTSEVNENFIISPVQIESVGLFNGISFRDVINDIRALFKSNK
jgi:hypothetical protein